MALKRCRGKSSRPQRLDVFCCSLAKIKARRFRGAWKAHRFPKLRGKSKKKNLLSPKLEISRQTGFPSAASRRRRRWRAYFGRPQASPLSLIVHGELGLSLSHHAPSPFVSLPLPFLPLSPHLPLLSPASHLLSLPPRLRGPAGVLARGRAPGEDEGEVFTRVHALLCPDHRVGKKKKEAVECRAQCKLQLNEERQ